jgi:glutathione S-transferase
MIQLYGAVQSGHSYKARLCLLLAQTPHDYIPVDISLKREARPVAFKGVSAFGEVPVMVHDGEVLAQSNAILLHLARFSAMFRAESDKRLNAITSWLFWEANRIGRSYPNLRWYRLFDSQGDPGLIAWFESTAKADLARLNEELKDKLFLLDTFSIVDISCAGYLLYGDDIGLDMQLYPHVLCWLDRIRAREGWQHPLTCMASA